MLLRIKLQPFYFTKRDQNETFVRYSEWSRMHPFLENNYWTAWVSPAVVFF